MRTLLIAGLMALSTTALAQDFDATKEKIEAAMKADIRGVEDTDRDRNRRPVETLEFFGLRDDMTVIELMPGGGWYTKILAPVLAEDGEYHAAYGTTRIAAALADKPGFEKMNMLAADAKISRPEGERFLMLENGDLGATDVDMVLTFRNYHNFSEAGRAAMNKAAFDALKSGGIYAVVDHTRRHMEATGPENGRRVDPVLVIKEVQEAGFDFVDFSTLHARSDDELRYEVGRKSVTGNSDRFTLKFRKP